MKNIFIQLKPKANLKKDSLLKMLDIDPEEEDSIPAVIQEYFEGEDRSPQHTAAFIMRLTKQFKEPALKEKLYALLVFFASKMQVAESIKIADDVAKSGETSSTKARFFALLFKSSDSNDLKKRLIEKTIGLIEKEAKISIFSNFIEHFDSLIASLNFQHNEYLKLYLQLINYLEKHLVYKKLVHHYIVHSLLNASPENAQTTEVDSLILKLLKFSTVTDESVNLLHQSNLKKNKFYPYLQILLLGDFDSYSKIDKKELVSAGVSEEEFQQRVKIEAIPRVLSSSRQNVQIVSYTQISQILKIKKEEVEGYIISAIHNGIIRAKIDESSQSIIINSVKLRSFQGEESAALQKNISSLAARLEQIAC